ncbi:hypothetical protein HHI36_006558 [Cryptolaemus montrouzieri]|uniref:SprT-like domain-containing protein n=1 Tax=Cryptolaemus montrouzieri TaxID=559131 RepID=A0ABD2NXK3_9CUCU
MDDSDSQFLSSLSPRIKPKKKVKCKAPTILSLKKHFRRSSIYDHSKATIPNDELIVIEISSTDSGSTGNYIMRKDDGKVIDEVEITSSSKEIRSSSSDDEIISPSPPKREVNMKCLSTSKKKAPDTPTKFEMLSKTKLFDIRKWVEDVNNEDKNGSMDGKNSLEASLASYEDFEIKRGKLHSNIVNSTMVSNLTVTSVHNAEKNEHCRETNNRDEEAVGDLDNSCEDLLDDLYGDSWRLKRNEILPQSERKPRKNKLTELQNIPRSERKPKKSETFKNPYLQQEKSKSDLLLKILQKKRMKEAIESPFINKLKVLCDEDSEDDVLVRTKLNLMDTPDKNNSDSSILGLIDEFDSNCSLHLSDKENSFCEEIIPLEDRIRKKKDFRELKLSEKFNKLNMEQCTNKDNGKSKKKTKKLYSEENSDVPSEIENNRVKSKVIFQEESKETDENKISTLSSPSPIRNNGENIGKKRVTRKKAPTTYFDSSESSEEDIDPIIARKEPFAKKEKEVNYSFLASLSKSIPDSQCDVSAKIFRNNYKQYKGSLAVKLFKLYNEKVFDNSLPENMKLEWNDRMLSTAGYCYSRKITRSTGVVERDARIVLSSKVLDSADRLRDTLIHEMCHAATWIVSQVRSGHGDHWKAWANKARQIFPELPPIKTCHNYQVNTKYVYKCTGCGYSIGRHRKSLDIERKRCGYCLGKFEILINKTTKKGEQKTVPATPKKEPTGFALFVKENYSDFKEPGRNHAEVMRMLSAKFKEMKV